MLLIAGWLIWHYPALPASDDALYLARGVTRFDVLNFAPNFPGYPGLIWLARIFAPWAQTPFQALMAVSLLLTLTATALAAAVYRRLTGDGEGAFFLALLLLFDPLWSQVALSGLSDGPGLCLLLAAWLAALYKRPAFSGALWGLALCVRPSYGLLALVLAGLILRRTRRSAFILPALVMGLAALLFVWSANGAGYFVEGWRFFVGHFTIWGDAVGDRSSGVSWPRSLLQAGGSGLLWGGSIVGGMLCIPWLHRRRPDMRPWLLLAATALAWAALAQNPDHLRHLIPVIVFVWGLLLAASFRLDWLKARRWVLAGMLVVQLVHYGLVSLRSPNLPPIQQAIQYLSRPHQIASQLVSHQAPDLLRERLPKLGIIDAYYAGDAALAMQEGALRLTSTHPKADNVQICAFYAPRFPGDTPLWLIRRHGSCAR